MKPSTPRPPPARHLVMGLRNRVASTFAAALLVLGTVTPARAAGREGPCDILVRAGTPCVAAHSTTRARYVGYDGPLYRVRRAHWRARDVCPLDTDGIADADAQNMFCAVSVCVVTRTYTSPRNTTT